ncbi:MAG: UpxY family transcription antiterminator [Terracidiphilus sp.]
MSESAQVLDASSRSSRPTDLAADRHWFAVYATCRHEKRIAQHFEQREIECYLPLYRTQRRWKDRSSVTLDLPLFPGYLFVRIDRPRRVTVLQVPGVLSLIGAMGSQFNPLPEFEIEALRNGLDPLRAEPHPLLLTGQRVRICKGALAGIEGIVVRKKNNLRVVLTLDLIMQSISLEVDEDDLEPVEFSPQMHTWRDKGQRIGDYPWNLKSQPRARWGNVSDC